MPNPTPQDIVHLGDFIDPLDQRLDHIIRSEPLGGMETHTRIRDGVRSYLTQPAGGIVPDRGLAATETGRVVPVGEPDRSERSFTYRLEDPLRDLPTEAIRRRFIDDFIRPVSETRTETWQCTPELRFRGPFLQQKWVSSRGEDDWRNVPQVPL